MGLITELFGKLESKKKGVVEKEWEFLADDVITTSPVVSKGTMIVFGTKSGKIFAVSSEGKKLWEYSMEKKLGKEQLLFLEEEKFRQVSADPVIADLNND